MLDAKQSIRSAILRWLAGRDYSQQEIAQKLSAKGFLAADFQPIIQDMVEKKLIDDRRFAEQFIHWRSNKGHGPLRILAELRLKGIDAEMIADQLKITDNAWLEQAKEAWRKRFKGRQALDKTEKAKQMRFLHYKGFTQEQIAYVLAERE